MRSYNPTAIETKWQELWASDDVHHVDGELGGPKYYCLEMLPYPSGRLHMGHVRNYSIGDAIARYRRMCGFRVMHPMGWDSFGMPAENAAQERGIHPAIWTRDNIATMRAQLKRLGFAYDWAGEIASHTPEYYRWNQWFFLRMLEAGLAYRKEAPLNWCSKCETVLANEQVEDGGCWRCGTAVEERRLEQWFFRITDFAEELLQGLPRLTGWPERVRIMQENWIGRSEGSRVKFKLQGRGDDIEVFTTRIDTIYGATFLVLAPEYPLASEWAHNGPGPDVDLDESEFRAEVQRLTHMDRRQRYGEEIEKAGVFTGHYAINPFSGERIPIWIANFVLMDYGTGAIMAVPAHDERDHEFARKYGLEIRPVIEAVGSDAGENASTDETEAASTADGIMMDNCGPYAGLTSAEGRKRMNADAEAGGFGAAAVDYRLKDWGISRQRYWGTPIPIIYCDECGVVPVPEGDLPVKLPEDVELTGKQGSPLARVDSFVNVECPQCSRPGRRETDTMDTFMDSSWYYLRYLSPHDDEVAFETDVARYWMPVDIYIGGITHAVLHLLYFRFFCKVLRDFGMLEVDEPTRELLTQGMVLLGGSAMSKSRGNVVDPDEMVARYGADATRIFVLFAAPPERDFEWDEGGIEGCSRFLNRAWTLVSQTHEDLERIESGEDKGTAGLPEQLVRLRRKAHDTTRRVTEELHRRLHFNTAIASLMELLNECYTVVSEVPLEAAAEHGWVFRDTFERFARLLAPFAPHLAQELWELLGHAGYILDAPWPSYDAEALQTEMVSLAVQINGKLRGRVDVPADLTDEEAILDIARSEPNVAQHLEEVTLLRTVVVPGRIVNLVVKG
jgi:leucyl-tRNA synthetase